MRLNLDDLKKRIVRRGGAIFLVPSLLRPGESQSEIAALIGLHESLLGQDRAAFPSDRPAELIGDYRLARCLVMVLAEDYTWAAPLWPGPADPQEAQALRDREITSPGQLRLALYDHVNAAHHGYLARDERATALDAFAARLGVRRATLDALLVLDSEERARLERTTPAVPTPAVVSARYNQRAVEALLNNASSIEWQLPPTLAAAQGLSLGTVLKQLCYLARRLGVYYDVAFAAAPEEPEESEDLARPSVASLATLARVAEPVGTYAADAAPACVLDNTAFRDRALRVTLYGPQELFGAPNQYGERLARLCRAWLGYHRQPEHAPPAGTPRRAAVSAANGLRGEAIVVFHGTSMRFTLDENLLAVLEGAAVPATPADPPTDPPASDPLFDSALESHLYDEFTALARAGATFGWRIEREPEPILAANIILIPDFALTRAGQRVYLEVAGFWTPDYRERKRRKLAALAGHTALIVAAPEDARAELGPIEALFPFLWFTGHVSAHQLIMLLCARFDDFAARRASVRLKPVVATIERRGFVPWVECGTLLHAFGTTEIAQLAGDVLDAASSDGLPPLVQVEGVGLMTAAWLERVRAAVSGWVVAATTPAAGAPLSLGEVGQRLRALVPAVGATDLPESAVEALVWATGHAVVRASLFEAEVVSRASADQAFAFAPPPPMPPQPRRPMRRTHHGTKTPSAHPPPSMWDLPETHH